MAVKTVQYYDGQTWYSLTETGEAGKWSAQPTAPMQSSYTQEGHYYPASLKIVDYAGNETVVDVTDTELGEYLHLMVKEKVAPVIRITSPTGGQLTSQSRPQIAWMVTDDDSGVNSGTIGLTIDSGSKITSGITKTEIEGGYQCSYTPTDALSDGEHTIWFDASDNDGNTATQQSVTFRVLATAPNLSIDSPVDGAWSKTPSLAFSGQTDGASMTVQVGDGTPQEIAITNGTFSGTVTLSTEGVNTIKFVATSESGIETTVTRTVKRDTVPPRVISIALTPNPVDTGAPYAITVEIED